ncbi:MAG TPA: fibronectin type III domain-containing protein, partial [Gemmatimonadales bacterium]|nr:fibronectin type III domain-containing protein [Gemmatimonadales bacterium]
VTSEGVRGTAAVTVTDPAPPPPPTDPGTVTNLAVAGVTDSSVTLSFTEVNDGAGAPADYFMRFGVAPMSWGSATDVDRGSCRVPIEGSTIGTSRSCTVSGLTPNTAYQFQLVAFRGTLNADAEFGGLSNVASGTTTASVAPPPPPPPPPPSPSGGWPNEPAGLTLLSDYGFGDFVPATNQGDLLGQGWRIWRNTDGHGTLAQDAGAPQSPSGVFQVHYPIGWLSGYEPAMVEYNFNQPVTELYWGFWWKPSNPFQSDASGVNKIAFVWTPSGATDLIYFDLSPGPWRIRAMDNLMAGAGPRAGLRDEPNVTTTVITLGQWHRIEIYLKYSTGSLANGVLKWWVDGVLNGHYTNLKMVQDGGFDHLQFAPTYGGNTGDRKAQHDYYWYDHVRVSRGP